MKTLRKIGKLLGNHLTSRTLIIVAAFSLILPLTSRAEDIVVWELDNFFAEENCSLSSPPCPDEHFTINIKSGDRLIFRNMGATDHDAASLFFEIDGQVFFDKELFGSNVQSPGDEFITPPIDIVGEIPFMCFIHGQDDMGGTIIVSAGDGDGPGNGAKSFTFNCNHSFKNGPAGLTTLTLNLGDTESCELKLNDFESGTFTEVLTTSRLGRKRSIVVSSASGMTDENGALEVTITATEEGIDWVAWCVPNEDGEIELNKGAYDSGYCWGMFVEVE